MAEKDSESAAKSAGANGNANKKQFGLVAVSPGVALRLIRSVLASDLANKLKPNNSTGRV